MDGKNLPSKLVGFAFHFAIPSEWADSYRNKSAMEIDD